MGKNSRINKNRLNTPLLLVESFFATWALMLAGRFTTGNIVTGIFFFFCFRFIRHSKNCYKTLGHTVPSPSVAIPDHNAPSLSVVSSILAALFTLFYMAVDAPHYIADLENRLFQMIILIAAASGYFFLFFHLARFFFVKALRRQHWMTILTHRLTDTKPFFTRLSSFYERWLGIITFSICFLGFLPWFLYLYPGILTPDSLNQLEQALGQTAYSNHHPFVHTMLIKLLYHCGQIFTDDLTTAVSFFTVFQMLVLSLTAAYLVTTLKKMSFRPIACFLATLAYAFLPYNAVYAVTIWKDVLFSAGVLLFSTALLRIYLTSTGHFSRPPSTIPGRIPLRAAAIISIVRKVTRHHDILVYLLGGLMMCLFRSNGWYAFLVSLPFLLYFFRNKFKAMLPLHIGLLLAVIVVKGPVMTGLNVTQPDFIESISVPLQQTAYVVYNDRTLTDSQAQQIDAVMDRSHVASLYHPGFADNIKELVRAGDPTYLDAHRSDYFKLWLSLGISWPGDYLTAYIQQTHG
ncbi:MAG: DUF6020 family protein, partial [Lachnospiraceae bacterium]|nr:DUF6020 family protein [Lachnospiraceae bacterium]